MNTLQQVKTLLTRCPSCRRPGAALASTWSTATQRRMASNSSLYTRFSGIIRDIIVGDDHINPKKILERNYLFNAILAVKWRNLRLQNPEEDKNVLRNTAIEILDSEGIDKMTNVELRKRVHEDLKPQILEMFRIFTEVDEIMRIPEYGLEIDIENADLDLAVNVLIKEHRRISQSANSTTESMPDWPFRELKLRALQDVLDFHDVDYERNPHLNEDDPFCLETQYTNDENMRILRVCQTINLCRSILVREKLGFCALSLRSMIPNAGRGVFLDGTAMCGSIVSFLPGEIWPKEHLLTSSPEVIEHFEGEDDCQITLRFDDYVIDSRQSPVTVIANPMALGHMINHPPKGSLPNCQSTNINYIGKELRGFMKYIPNEYAKDPTWQSRFFDAEDVMMHGLCHIAHHEVSNEELLYDYRLQSNETPDWYHVVNYGDSFDRHDQVVFFRDDWREEKDED